MAETGSSEIEYPIKVKSLVKYGISLIEGKIYNARDCGVGWFALFDEVGGEYAYPPELFEVIDQH